MKLFKNFFVDLCSGGLLSYKKKSSAKFSCLVALLIVTNCTPIKEKSLQEINADMEVKIKNQTDYFLNIKTGDFVPLNRILNHLPRLNEKEVLTRGVLIVTDEKTVVSDRDCPASEGAPQLRELFIQKEGINEMPASGTYVEISGVVSTKSAGDHGMWPGSFIIKSIKAAKATAQDCAAL